MFCAKFFARKSHSRVPRYRNQLRDSRFNEYIDDCKMQKCVYICHWQIIIHDRITGTIVWPSGKKIEWGWMDVPTLRPLIASLYGSRRYMIFAIDCCVIALSALLFLTAYIAVINSHQECANVYYRRPLHLISNTVWKFVFGGASIKFRGFHSHHWPRAKCLLMWSHAIAILLLPWIRCEFSNRRIRCRDRPTVGTTRTIHWKIVKTLRSLWTPSDNISHNGRFQ